MHRRLFLACLALAAACATAPPQPQGAGFASGRIEVTSRGRGPDVILTPGMTSHRSVWDATADALDRGHRVHVVQVKGFAGFPAEANAEGPVSAPVAEEIARYIAEAGLERPAIIGHSMGGTNAMMIAARHPQSVGRIMVVDMFPFMGAMFGPPGASADSVRATADQIRAQMRLAPQGAASPMVEQMIASMVATESARPALLQHARDSDNRVVANAFHELIVTDLRPELAGITAPMSVLYVIPPNAPVPETQYDAFMRLSYAGVSQARVVRIDGARHFIMIDAFDRFMQEVNAFLSG